LALLRAWQYFLVALARSGEREGMRIIRQFIGELRPRLVVDTRFVPLESNE
jgi:hypothetical protein